MSRVQLWNEISTVYCGSELNTSPFVKLGGQARFISHPRFVETVFPKEVVEIIEMVAKEVAPTTETIAFPDATYEGWGIPTGLLFRCDSERALLFPTFLRDPGCGFLLFRVELASSAGSEWRDISMHLIDSLVRRDRSVAAAHNPFMTADCDLRHVLRNGHLGLEGWCPNELRLPMYPGSAFSDFGCADIELTGAEEEALRIGFCSISNTVELRVCTEIISKSTASTWDLHEGCVVGMVHTGCSTFSNILESRFACKAAEQSLDTGLFSMKAVERGVFGVTMDSDLGRDYVSWLCAAVNYAVANRLAVYAIMKALLEDALPCELVLLSDAVHVGFRSEAGREGDCFLIYRGVQPLGLDQDETHCLPTLLAGHRETPSVLISPGQNSHLCSHMICHGTSWNRGGGPVSELALLPRTEQEVLSLASRARCNTSPDLDACIPYTANLLACLSHFAHSGLAEPVAILAPAVNIQGEDHIQGGGRMR